MTVLVTGGFGYLGSAIAERFRLAGTAVRIVTRRVPPPMADWACQFDVRIADVTRTEDLTDVCEGVRLVLHTAAATEQRCASDPRAALEVNGLGTRNILERVASAQVPRLIYFSTFHVYGVHPTRHLTEELPPSPRNSYGLTHLVGELYVNLFRDTHAVDATSVRISNGYGPCLVRDMDRWTLVLNDFCRQAIETRRIRFRTHGFQQRDFVSIDDIWQAVLLLANAQGSLESVYNLGGDRSKTMREVAAIVARVYSERYGGEVTCEYPPDDDRSAPEPPCEYDISRLAALGYRPADRMAEAAGAIFSLLEQPVRV